MAIPTKWRCPDGVLRHSDGMSKCDCCVRVYVGVHVCDNECKCIIKKWRSMIDEGYLTGMMSAEIHTWGQKFKKKERKGGLVKKEKPHMYLKQIIIKKKRCI